jgi:hypothetical protein
MERTHLSLPYLGKKSEIRDGSCFLVAFISSRDGHVWDDLGFPLPKNYLNSQLNRRLGSRLFDQLFVLGFEKPDGNLYSSRVAGRAAD